MNKDNKASYGYREDLSVLEHKTDFEITPQEMAILYDFYVMHTIEYPNCFQKRAMNEYGWKKGFSDPILKKQIRSVFDANDKSVFANVMSGQAKSEFERLSLTKENIHKSGLQRIAMINAKDPRYKAIVRHIRDCLAHARFDLVIDPDGDKIIIMENKNDRNFTARMYLMYETLFRFIEVIDKNRLTDILNLQINMR